MRKKQEPAAIEVNLNLVPLLKSLGLEKVVAQAMKAAQKGEINLLENIATAIAGRIQDGELSVQIAAGGKKKKVPIRFSVRLKKP
ncbi:MAG: hypothetical protein ACK4GQ_05220 [Candidatus Hadarchaeales archaeon]